MFMQALKLQSKYLQGMPRDWAIKQGTKPVRLEAKLRRSQRRQAVDDSRVANVANLLQACSK